MATYPTCDAKSRAGTPCQRPAGWGTDHAGEGRCKLHGGCNPIKHGRYSTVSRPRVRELIEKLATESNQLDLLPEVQLIRALLVDYVERYDTLVEALFAWNADEAAEARMDGRKPRPQPIPPLHEAASLAERAARVVDMIQRQKKEAAISLETFNRVMEQMGISVARHVADAEALRRIEAEWLGIQVG